MRLKCIQFFTFILLGLPYTYSFGAGSAIYSTVKEQEIKNNQYKSIQYEKEVKNNHVIHILTIDPAHYHFELVKARNQVFGRETVKAIALRKNAIAAINGGFFEIGGTVDGYPSGTLIIDQKIFALKKTLSALLAWNGKDFYIGQTAILSKLIQGENNLTLDKVNQSVSSTDKVVLYTDVWGPTSLTPHARQEFLFDATGNLIAKTCHGDNPIPRGGWILSVPKTSSVAEFMTVGKKVKLELEFKKIKGQENPDWHIYKNFIMGIPLLVSNGKPVPGLEHSGIKSFVLMPHARTAFGIRQDGKIVMVVAEHHYNQSLNQLTLEEAQKLLQVKGHSRSAIEKMSLAEARAILSKQLSRASCVGLNLLELAKLMISLGCKSAINLDGGGSSTLFLNGRIVNTTIGDEDESKGQQIIRPVSDAIVVVKS